MRSFVVFVIIVAAVGCSKSGSTTAPGAGPGKERGACYGNGTCDQGLVCLSDLCVAPPGADCAAVAEHLGGLLLGNYAPKGERATFLAEVQADCAKVKLTKEDGDCLLRAEGRQAIGGCPHPLGVGDCAAIVAHLKTLLPQNGTDQWLVTPADRLIARCKNEVPSKGLEICVLAATKVDQVEHCTW